MKRKLILDTDIGPDCDDCGALAILDRYHCAGVVELIGVTHCTSDLLGVDVIASINDWFGVDVPIGQTERKGFLADLTKYTAPVSEAYLKNHDKPKYESALGLLRRLLHENRDVTLVFIGPLNNMSDLLMSGADEISPLSGEELVRQSVAEVIVMGGNFENLSHGEYNIFCDVPAAQATAERCPVPITYCGFEAGEHVITGASLANCDDSYPVKLAYRSYLDGKFERPSWDLATVYYAVSPDKCGWVLSDECQIRYKDDATAVISEGHGAKYVRYANERKLERILNGIISEEIQIFPPDGMTLYTKEATIKRAYDIYLRAMPKSYHVSRNSFKHASSSCISTCYTPEYELAGFALTDGSSIQMLCVAPEFQGQGYGKKLLESAEKDIRKNAPDAVEITLGRGGGSGIVQGVPTETTAVGFFQKYGYTAGWVSDDMYLDLTKFDLAGLTIPACPADVEFRFANMADESVRAEVLAAVDEVDLSWHEYFEHARDGVYVAVLAGKIVGFELVEPGGRRFRTTDEDEDMGSIGCVGVISAARRQGIGLQMVAHGANWLKQSGCVGIELLYTHLAHWYRGVGFEVTHSQWMGEKKL